MQRVGIILYGVLQVAITDMLYFHPQQTLLLSLRRTHRAICSQSGNSERGVAALPQVLAALVGPRVSTVNKALHPRTLYRPPTNPISISQTQYVACTVHGRD